MYDFWHSAETSRYGSAFGTRTQTKTCLDTRFLGVKYLPLTFLSTPGQIVFFKYNLKLCKMKDKAQKHHMIVVTVQKQEKE